MLSARPALSLPNVEQKGSTTELFRAIFNTVIPKKLITTPAAPHPKIKELNKPYDVVTHSYIDQLMDELHFNRINNLKRDFATLQYAYSTVIEYYSAGKLSKQTEEALRASETRRQESILWQRAVTTSLTDFEWETVEDEKNEKVSQPRLLGKVSSKIKEIQDDIAVLAECKRLGDKLNPLSAIRSAAKRYCQLCNEALEKNRDQKMIDQYASAAQLFGCSAAITYVKKEGKFRYQNIPPADKYSPKVVMELLNLSIKTSAPIGVTVIDKEAGLALACLSEEMMKDEWKALYNFNNAGFSSSVEVRPGYASLEVKFGEMLTKSQALIKKYKPNLTESSLQIEEDDEKKAVDDLIQKMKKLTSLFNKFEQDFDDEYERLGVVAFRMSEAKNMQVLYDKFDIAYNALVDEIKLSQVNCSTMHLFQTALNKIRVAQKDLDQKIDETKVVTKRNFSQFKENFDGLGVSNKLNQAIQVLDELKNISNDHINKADVLAQNKEYQFAQKELERKMAIRNLLQFLQEQVVSQAMLKNFWSQEVRTLSFGCFFIGGSRVQLDDETSVIVPHGIAQIYQKIKNKKLELFEIQDIIPLYRHVKDGIKNRVDHHGAGRSDATTGVLYRLLIGLPDTDTAKERDIEFFKANFMKMIGLKNKKNTLQGERDGVPMVRLASIKL